MLTKFAIGLALVMTVTTVNCAPIMFDEEDNEVDNPDYDTFQNLMQLGEKLYGEPKNTTGELELFEFPPHSIELSFMVFDGSFTNLCVCVCR